MSTAGSLLFAKYAYSPNKMGYCGPAQGGAIFDYCVANCSDEGLVDILKGFEGAFPYLKIIAESNGIKDYFDTSVVEAYWIGNNLLGNVKDKIFYDSLNERFTKKIGKNPMKWILTKPIIGAKPHHSFHVLDIYTKTGLSRSGLKTIVLETINNCLIMWGKVVKTQSSKLKTKNLCILYNPIILKNGKLTFGKIEKKELISPFINPKKGDIVSFHWGSVCEILNREKVMNLKKWTAFHLDIANKTI